LIIILAMSDPSVSTQCLFFLYHLHLVIDHYRVVGQFFGGLFTCLFSLVCLGGGMTMQVCGSEPNLTGMQPSAPIHK
jgi:hypothetical protein